MSTDKDLKKFKNFRKKLTELCSDKIINNNDFFLGGYKSFTKTFKPYKLEDKEIMSELISEWNLFQIKIRKEIIEGDIKIISKVIEKLENKKGDE